MTPLDVVFAGVDDLPRLQAGLAPEVLVFCADLQVPALQPVLLLAPTREDAKDHVFAGASSRQDFLRRRALTRTLVAWRLGVAPDDVVIAYNREGGPDVISPGKGLFVSVSSRGSTVSIAMAARPVGVDLEPGDPATQPLFDVLHPQEQGLLRALPADARGLPFLALWTAKEAGLKAQGSGLKRNPAEIWVTAARLGDGDFVVQDAQGRIGTGAWQTLLGCLVAVAG